MYASPSTSLVDIHQPSPKRDASVLHFALCPFQRRVGRIHVAVDGLELRVEGANQASRGVGLSMQVRFLLGQIVCLALQVLQPRLERAALASNGVQLLALLSHPLVGALGAPTGHRQDE